MLESYGSCRGPGLQRTLEPRLASKPRCRPVTGFLAHPAWDLHQPPSATTADDATAGALAHVAKTISIPGVHLGIPTDRCIDVEATAGLVAPDRMVHRPL